MYIFVFKYLNTSFAAIPRERVRKIFRRLFTEPLLPLREARRFLLRLPSIPFDSLERKSWLFFFFFSLHSSFFFLLFLSLFLSLLPFSSREEDFIEPRHFLRVISYCHGSSCRTIKRWTERNGETPFSFSRAKRREEGGGEGERRKKSNKENRREVCVLEWQHEVSSTYRRLLLRSYAIVHCSTNNKVD